MAGSKNNSFMIGGLVFVGCILIGSAIGMLSGNNKAGSMIGTGVGFLALAGIWWYGKNPPSA